MNCRMQCYLLLERENIIYPRIYLCESCISRHQIKKAETDTILSIYQVLYDYIVLAKRKAMHDKVKCYYEE